MLKRLYMYCTTTKCSPTTCLEFLGIEIDTAAMQARLPGDKLVRLGALIVEWRQKKKYTRRDLQTLVGHLSYACNVAVAF